MRMNADGWTPREGRHAAVDGLAPDRDEEHVNIATTSTATTMGCMFAAITLQWQHPATRAMRYATHSNTYDFDGTVTELELFRHVLNAACKANDAPPEHVIVLFYRTAPNRISAAEMWAG